VGSYRPICDVWILARSRTKYYGAYPYGFLSRAREILGVHIEDPVLHVCSGKIDDYPYDGLGFNDVTVDLDPAVDPDFVMDIRKELPANPERGDGLWPAIMADPPYSEEDADHYTVGRDAFPEPNKLLKLCLEHVRPGGRVGMLHYVVPRPPSKMDGKKVKFVACVGVMVGFSNRIRAYTVFERPI